MPHRLKLTPLCKYSIIAIMHYLSQSSKLSCPLVLLIAPHTRVTHVPLTGVSDLLSLTTHGGDNRRVYPGVFSGGTNIKFAPLMG